MKLLLRPYNVCIITIIMSFIFWIFPNFDILRKGFTEKNPIFDFSLVYIFSIYMLFYFSVYIGFKKSKKIKFLNKYNRSYNNIKSKKIYKIYLLISTIGVMFTLISIIKILGLSEIYKWINLGQANKLKYALYKNYSLGLLSLRYISAQSFALMLIRRVYFKIKSKFDYVALFNIFVCTIIASRLLLIYSIFSFVLYGISIGKLRGIKTSKKFLFILFIYITLNFLTFTRTKNFYLKYYGLGFLGSGFSEILTYLGTPFQGSLTMARLILSDNFLTLDKFYIISTIERSLTTNSSIVQLYFQYGYYYILIFILTGLFFGYLSRLFLFYKNTCLFFVYSMILYCFAEVWRTFIFFEGITITLTIIPVAIYFLLPTINKIKK